MQRTEPDDLATSPLLLSAADARRLLGLGHATWYRLLAEGLLPAAVAVPGLVDPRWRRDDLARWVQGLKGARPSRRTARRARDHGGKQGVDGATG